MTLFSPNSDLQLIINKEINEDDENRDRNVAVIKTWLLQEPHLPDTWDERCILNFLRGCKFSLEKCKKKLDMYFTLKAAIPEFFTNRDLRSPELEDVSKKTHIFPLPRLTPTGKRVILFANSSEYDFLQLSDVCKYVTMLADVKCLTEKFGVAGDVILLDGRLQLLKTFLKMSPVTFRKFFFFLHNACPVRVQEIHIINATPVVRFMYKSLKPLLTEKVKSRVHIHDGMEDLYDFVPRDVLPEEYGGTAGKTVSLKENWLREVDGYREWFKGEEGVMADEEKRVKNGVNFEELFGVEGSFKQLEVD